MKLHILCKFQLNILKIWILWPKNLKNVTKSAESPFALFAQSQSLILLLLHFSIFLVEILKLASQLNLAAILLIRFLNCAKMAPKKVIQHPIEAKSH